MIIDTETKRKLREMNATDLLDAFERLDEQTTMPLSHAEVIRLAVDSAHSGHMDARIQRLVKRAVYLCNGLCAGGGGDVLLDSGVLVL